MPYPLAYCNKKFHNVTLYPLMCRCCDTNVGNAHGLFLLFRCIMAWWTASLRERRKNQRQALVTAVALIVTTAQPAAAIQCQALGNSVFSGDWLMLSAAGMSAGSASISVAALGSDHPATVSWGAEPCGAAAITCASRIPRRADAADADRRHAAAGDIPLCSAHPRRSV
jgi:hypothetical protein